MNEQDNQKNNLLIPSLKANRKKSIVQKRRAFLFSSPGYRGSMTVEASMVLPIFIFFMMTLLMGIEYVRLQSNIFAGLVNADAAHRQQQIQRVMLDQEMLTSFEDGVVQQYLDGQEMAGLCLMNDISVINNCDVRGNGRIQLEVQYRVKPFIYWLPIGNNEGGGLSFQDELFTHDFNGYRGPIEGEVSEAEEIVFITEKGSRYHSDIECTSLRITVQTVHSSQISGIRNQSGGRYYPCERCRPSGTGVFFITKDGDRYHSGTDCSSLKRTVSAVSVDEAIQMGRTACRKCS